MGRMKKLVFIVLVFLYYTGSCFAQDAWQQTVKKLSLSELEQEKTALMREIKRLKSFSDAYSKSNAVALGKRLKWTNEEIARRPKPQNPVTDNRNDASSAREKQEKDDRIRLEEQRIRQRAYDATMARTQVYYDNLKANAAYHASAEGVAVASALVDPSHYMNPGQADYIPSSGPPRYVSDKVTVKRRMQQLRRSHIANNVDSEGRGREEELENRFSACNVTEYPSDKNILEVFENLPPNVRDGDECGTSIFIQKIDSSEFAEINAALVFSLPQHDLQLVETNNPDQFCDPLESDWDAICEKLSARHKKKHNTLMMLDNIVATYDSEIGGNLIDAAENVNKIVVRTTIDGFMNQKLPGISNAQNVVFESLMEVSANNLVENGFDDMRRMHCTPERISNPVAEKLSAIRDGAELADKFSVIKSGSGLLSKSVPVQVVMNAPEAGQAIGSVAASVVIYYRRKEVAEQREAVIAELDYLNEQLKTAEKFRAMKREPGSIVEVDRR